jgi:hypothetical protein
MDNKAPYWKERFIDYFAHKIKEKFNNCHNDYISLTYRRIINAIKLNLLRLTNHFKDKKYDKKELDSVIMKIMSIMRIMKVDDENNER